jgi:hypothetical protein
MASAVLADMQKELQIKFSRYSISNENGINLMSE